MDKAHHKKKNSILSFIFLTYIINDSFKVCNIYKVKVVNIQDSACKYKYKQVNNKWRQSVSHLNAIFRSSSRSEDSIQCWTLCPHCLYDKAILKTFSLSAQGILLNRFHGFFSWYFLGFTVICKTLACKNVTNVHFWEKDQVVFW